MQWIENLKTSDYCSITSKETIAILKTTKICPYYNVIVKVHQKRQSCAKLRFNQNNMKKY